MKHPYCRQTMGIALAGILLAGGASSAHADHTQASPDQEAGTNSVLSGGLVTFGVSYGAALIVAMTSSHAGDNRLFVPLLGPWLDLGERGGCPIGIRSCDRETTYKVLLVVDGVFQAAGAIGILSGLLSPGHGTGHAASRVRVVPVTLARGAPGLIALGSF